MQADGAADQGSAFFPGRRGRSRLRGLTRLAASKKGWLIAFAKAHPEPVFGCRPCAGVLEDGGYRTGSHIVRRYWHHSNIRHRPLLILT